MTQGQASDRDASALKKAMKSFLVQELSAVALMLDYLKEDKLACNLKDAIARVIEEGKVRTYDLGGTDSTLDVAKEVARKVISNQ